jgi:superfamily I DNA/RNA helicase
MLERLLAASFHLRFSLASGIRDDEEDIQLLTEQQSRLLRILSGRKRIAICGGAGTGKTAMAVQKALELSEAGQQVLLTCFNRPLAARLRTLAAGSTAIVESFHGLCARAMAATGQTYEATEAEYRRLGKAGLFDQEALPGALLAAAAEYPEFQFDAVIVDEGQDFHAGWWAALDACAKSSRDLMLCAFFDNNQSVYADRAASAIRLLEVLDFPLSENLRNTRRIFACAKGLYKGDAYTSAGPEGREVAWLTANSVAETRRRVGETVGQLCKVEHVAAEDIVILTCRGVDAHSLAGLAHIAGTPVTRAEAPRKGHLIVDSVRRFKGLESPIMLLVDIEPGVDDEILYVGLTRARSHLICFGVDAMKQRLSAMGAPFR